MKRFTILKTTKYLFNRHRNAEAGFNLVEVATVVIIAGILAAIIAPSWVAFTNRQRLQAAQSNVFRAMQSAQTRARGNRETWQFSFDSNTNPSRWAIHTADVSDLTQFPDGTASGGIAENTWYPLEEKIKINKIDEDNLREIDPINNPEDDTQSNNEVYRILFNERGCPVTEIAQECTQSSLINNQDYMAMLILSHEQLGEMRRCVRVDTLLGAMRMADGDACDPNS
jgi:prepilin-type N-terminal cleavage/methylation domain-containing protein